MGEPDQNTPVGRGGRRGSRTTPTETPQENKTPQNNHTGLSKNKSQNEPVITDQDGQTLDQNALENIKADSINITVDNIPLPGEIMDQLSDADITSAQDALNVYNKIKELIQADKLNIGNETESVPQKEITGRGGRSRGAATTQTHQAQKIDIEVFNGAEEVASIEGTVKPDIPAVMKELENTQSITTTPSNKGFNH